MARIKVLLVDDVEETRHVIGKILKIEKDRFEVVGNAANGAEAIAAIPACKPDIVLMDINMPVMNGLEATEAISMKYPEVSVIIMSVQAESEYLKKAMFCGAKEYIIKPIDYDTLVNTIESTYNKYKNRVVAAANKEEQNKQAHIISIYSGKGGVGKSVIATNLSIILANIMHKKTLLLDLNLQYGDIALMMNQNNKKTILDLVDDHQLDSYEAIEQYLSHYNENLDALLAPKSPEGGEYISKDVVEQILNHVSGIYDCIIIDTAVNFDETTLHALDRSDQILVVTNMDLTSVKSTKLCLSVMKTLNYNEDKVKVIVNEANDSFGVAEKEVSDIFKTNLIAVLPAEEKNIRQSINKGIPAAAAGTKLGSSKFVKRLQEMGKKLVHEIK